MSTLLVDNYDSYTYNVFHLVASVSGEEPIVIRNDAVSWRALARWDFDAIVLSPGPGRPERWHDFGVCSDILRQSEIPVLGICLGHQGLGQILNGTVTSAPTVMHGRLSNVHHDGDGLFEDIPQGFSVVRYHSLTVASQLGREGRVTAWTDEGVVMGIEHRGRPLWGVQFHPESIATEHGRKLLENFYSLAHSRRTLYGRSGARTLKPPSRIVCPPVRPAGADHPQLRMRTIDGEPSAELLFDQLLGLAEHAFWLDSVGAPTRLAQQSFLGSTEGPHRCVLEYDIDRKVVTSHRPDTSVTKPGSIFDVIKEALAACTYELPRNVPAGLIGGFVGYLGYECKADCGSPNVHHSDMPDAVLMLANRVVAIDHSAQQTHLLALCHDDDREEAEHWLAAAETLVRATIDQPSGIALNIKHGAAGTGPLDGPVRFRCGRGREQYLADIIRCQAALSAGESYEVCLTDQIHTDVQPEPFSLYRTLRRHNPAPFAAYLRLGDMAIVSSSPERFLSVDRDRHVEARPIKGTAPRSDDAELDEAAREGLLNDEKTFAEHLMIVDLLRNDLGRVCQVNSVRVPEFMVVEPYQTVHQLISTITGELDDARTPVECVRACFPGGSMTGAPKLRTMGIIDDIEREARGVYSGALGYFGVDGTVDLSIVIRTIVIRPGDTTIGAGGAIVMQSDPAEEFNELLLKARAPMLAITRAMTGSNEEENWTVELERGAPVAVEAP